MLSDRSLHICGKVLAHEQTFNAAVRQQAQGRYDNFASILFNGHSGANSDYGIANSDCGSRRSIDCLSTVYAAGWEILILFVDVWATNSTAIEAMLLASWR